MDPQMSDTQALFDAYNRLVVENYFIVASSAILFFDFGLTFTSEVQRVWNRKQFSYAALIFFLNRYTVLVERVVLLIEILLQTDINERCVPVMRLDDTLTALTYLASGSFTVLRLFAVGVKDWKILVCLAALCLVRPTISIFDAVGYAPIAIGSPLYGCASLYSITLRLVGKLGIVSRSTTIAADTLLIVYTWYKTYGTYAAMKLEHKTSIAYLLLRDGTIYFISIVLIHILSIISDTIGSGSVIFSVWAYFDQVFTPIFLCRLILNLREVDNASCGNDESGQFSDLHFSSIPFGNLGAPLDFACDAGADVCAEEEGDSASLDESSPGLPSPCDGMELVLCEESGPSTSTQGLYGSAESSGASQMC